MGVFDYLTVEMPLPADPPPPAHPDFQTKDTPEQYLGHYTITADGRLVWHRVDREYVKDATALLGFRAEVVGREDVALDDFHGDLHFHDYDTATKTSWSYVARFTEGRCVRIWHEAVVASDA